MPTGGYNKRTEHYLEMLSHLKMFSDRARVKKMVRTESRDAFTSHLKQFRLKN